MLFLDEPTTGLDPQNRENLWGPAPAAPGTTICLTTRYLDEADQLRDRVAILDHGRVIALGTPDQLKRRYSADSITLTPDVTASGLPALARELVDASSTEASVTENGAIRLTVTETTPCSAPCCAMS